MPDTVDRLRFAYDYVGPRAGDRPKPGTPCTIIRRLAGAYKVRTENGRVWIIATDQIERVA